MRRGGNEEKEKDEEKKEEERIWEEGMERRNMKRRGKGEQEKKVECFGKRRKKGREN